VAEPVERLVFSLGEAADALRVSRPTVRAAIARGEPPAVRLGRRVLIPRAALLRLLEPANVRTGAELVLGMGAAEFEPWKRPYYADSARTRRETS
jgi:excisionase family DNA binding protein